MALGPEVVDLIGLNLLDNPNQIGAVGEIAVVEDQPWISLIGILIQVINPVGVVREAGRRPKLLARRLMPCTS